ncbi:MAG TPA: phosphotransferase [bacterium]|nr:phosphotransferase [bacterium]
MPAASVQHLEPLRLAAQRALGSAVDRGELLHGGGSERRYYRFRALEPGTGAASCVGVLGAQGAETRAFLGFTRHFAAQGIPVPRVLEEAPDQHWYLLEDLGPFPLSESLRRWRAQPGGAAQAQQALLQVVEWLPVLQVRGGQGLDYSLCVEGTELAGAAYGADVELFLGQYVPRFVLGERVPAPAVLRDLGRLVSRLDALPRQHFCHRDFQTRNIMWAGQGAAVGPVFLDYQGGRRGALAYDLASLLYSPDSGLGEPERQTLQVHYLRALAGQGVAVEEKAFLAEFHAVVLVRRLQALGAYVRIALGAGKSEYLDKIPAALATLRELQAGGHLRMGLPALEEWLAQAVLAPAESAQ